MHTNMKSKQQPSIKKRRRSSKKLAPPTPTPIQTHTLVHLNWRKIAQAVENLSVRKKKRNATPQRTSKRDI